MSRQTKAPITNLVSIAEAAKQAGTHRRTIERWIGSGQLSATKSATDRRKKLVDLDEVQAMAAAAERQRLSTAPPLPEREMVIPEEALKSSQAERVSAPLEPWDFEEVMDNAVQLVYSHTHRMISQLYPGWFRPLTLDQLRNGPLGQDLLRLAQLARGQSQEPQELVLEAIDSVLQLLFWPAAMDDYSVPRAFWDTDLGRMLALAKYQAYRPSELMSIGDAADQLGVTRPMIYRWMDDRSLSYVRDDLSGRTFVVRRDVENIKRVQHEF